MEEIENLEEDVIIPDGIVLLPPDEGEDSAEDSGDEECNDPDRLGSAQLNAEAEFYYENNNPITEDDVDPPSPLAQTKEGPSKKKKKQKSFHRNRSCGMLAPIFPQRRQIVQILTLRF